MSINKIFMALSCPFVTLGLLGLASLVALIAALAGEYVFGLEPCILCLYQRIPFAAVFLFALIGILARNKNMMLVMLILSSLAMFTNAGIATYHTGVEQSWWASEVEGCKVDFGNTEEQKDLLTMIMGTPSVSCDQIPWVDPIFGLSMANWNIPFCFGLAFLALIGFVLARRASVKDCPGHGAQA